MKEKSNQPINVETLCTTSLHHPTAEPYTAPQIEIIDIELTQNILSGSLPPIGDGGWG
jgi:hypothetical protein